MYSAVIRSLAPALRPASFFGTRRAGLLFAGAWIAGMLGTLPGALAAQRAPVPAIDPPARGAAAWRTIETEHFRFHYRRAFEAWTHAAATRAEGIREAVGARVDWVPARPVTVLVDDPDHVSNGFAISWLDAPQIRLYPVPPDARSSIGRSRDWGELLLVHEYAHLAHLTRPRRSAWASRRAALFPGPIGPLATGLPRWVKEGYATLIEGAVTGSGRPASALRSAVLRRFAADGRLPTYGALDGSPAFLGDALPYLVGSAYLEHLAAQHGDSALPQLWRRTSARSTRSFGNAFEQTFGVRPEQDYARYTARLTADAIAMEDAMRERGLIEGVLEVAGTFALGDPALSADGTRLALTLPRVGNTPGRLVVWSTATVPDAERDSLRRAQADRLRERDSLDVPSVPLVPRGKRVLASLAPVQGMAWRTPRFLPDGERLLVVRSDMRGDGSLSPDLFLWDLANGRVQRLTQGAAVREADPFPDGRQAVGTRCRGGQCDLVRIDFRNGDVSTLRAGSPYVQYTRPRVSPDGSRIAAVEQRDGRWRVVLVDPASGNVTAIGADDGHDRFDAAWLRDGRGLLLVSETGGIPDLERLDLASGRTTRVTRMFGAAFAPEPLPADSAAYFLSLTARGYDLRRIALDRAAATDTTTGTGFQDTDPWMTDPRITDPRIRDAVRTRPSFTVPRFAEAAVGPPRSYGLGPRRLGWYPAAGATTDGVFAGGALLGFDPIDRFSWMLQGMWSADPRLPRGGTLQAVLRLPHVSIHGDLVRARDGFGPMHAPRAEDSVTSRPPLADPGRTIAQQWTGASLALTHAQHDLLGVTGIRLGAARHAVRYTAHGRPSIEHAAPGGDAVQPVRAEHRDHGWIDVQRVLAVRRGTRSARLDARVHGSASRAVPQGPVSVPSLDTNRFVTRRISMLSADLALGSLWRVHWEGSGGASNARDETERFALGGAGSRLVSPSALPQRITVPWLTTGEVRSRRFVQQTLSWTALPDIHPFFWSMRASGVAGGRSVTQRAVGVETRYDQPGLGHLRFPGISGTAGVAWLLDDPHADRLRAWIAVSYRP